MSDDSITSIITNKTVGMDQLEGFDSIGQAGPSVTFEIACIEVKRLTAECKELREIVDAARNVLDLLNSEDVSHLFDVWNDWFEKTEAEKDAKLKTAPRSDK